MKQKTPENCARLSQLAINLSSVLPKVSDTSIFEIDDIIYGDDNNDVVAGTNVAPQETINYLVENCYKHFFDLFESGDIKCGDRFVEMAFLQLLELVPDGTYITIPKIDAFGTLKTIAYDIEPGYLEHFLKVLKVTLNCHKVVFVMQSNPNNYLDSDDEERELIDVEDDDLYHLIALLLIFSHPEDCKSENQKDIRKASWLTKQCSDMLETLTTLHKIDDSLKSYIATFKDEKKRYNSKFVWLLKHGMNHFVRKIGMTFCSKHLFKYFTSAQNDDERSQRIRDFNEAIFDCYRPPTLSIQIVLKILPQVGFYTKEISDYIFKLFQKIKNYPSSTMRKLEQHCGFDVTSYLLNDADCSTYLAFKEEAVDLAEKYFKKSNISDFVAKSEEVEFGEELSLYHEFVNGLLLIDIMHIIWLKMKNIVKIDNIHPGFFDEYFRPHDSPIKTSINELIADPRKRGRGDWWIQAILRKCPFLILSHDNKSHLEDLMNLLIGRNVDKATEELLHSVINMNIKAPNFYCYQESRTREKVDGICQLPQYSLECTLFSAQPFSVNGRYVDLPSISRRSKPVTYFMNSDFIGYYYYYNKS